MQQIVRSHKNAFTQEKQTVQSANVHYSYTDDSVFAHIVGRNLHKIIKPWTILSIIS